MSNPSITRDSISLMIYESLGAVCAFESMRHQLQQFAYDFCLPKGCFGCRMQLSHGKAVR